MNDRARMRPTRGTGLLAMSAAVCLSVVLAGCDDDVTPAASVRALRVSPDSFTVVDAGGQIQFTALAVLSNGSEAAVSTPVVWRSTDSTIARVSMSGQATGVRRGRALVVATSTIGGVALVDSAIVNVISLTGGAQ